MLFHVPFRQPQESVCKLVLEDCLRTAALPAILSSYSKKTMRSHCQNKALSDNLSINHEAGF